MDDSLRMNDIERSAGARQDLGSAAITAGAFFGTPAANESFERFALKELHGVVEIAVRGAALVERDDVGALEASDGLNLANDACSGRCRTVIPD